MGKADIWTPDDETRFTMRIDNALLERVKALAVRNKRSTAKQIEFFIESCISEYEREHGAIRLPEEL